MDFVRLSCVHAFHRATQKQYVFITVGRSTINKYDPAPDGDQVIAHNLTVDEL